MIFCFGVMTLRCRIRSYDKKKMLGITTFLVPASFHVFSYFFVPFRAFVVKIIVP